MHPQVTSDKPGSCSICGMDLVKAKAREATMSGEAPSGLAPIRVSEETARRIGLRFAKVEKRPFSKNIRAAARIAAEEPRIHRIFSKIEGYAQDLRVDYTGAYVKKGQAMMGIYSLGLVSIQQQYLAGVPGDGRRFVAPPRPAPGDANPTASQEDVMRQRLLSYDFSYDQIDRILKTRQAEDTLEVGAPATGYVTQKNVFEGQRILPGDLLYEVTDLSQVWAEAEVNEMDVPLIRKGMPVTLTLPSLPGKRYRGTVRFFVPVVNPSTRTMKVVAEVPNREVDLKPGMFADVVLDVDQGEQTVVPEGAVLRSGLRDYVFVRSAGGDLVPTEVGLGMKTDGAYQVLRGLNQGEEVALGATFLVDSESNLQAALQAAAAGQAP